MTNMYLQLLCGKERILRELGEGGMAQVFEGEHVKLGQRGAIRDLRDELCGDRAFVERFDCEGRALSRLESRHVVRVFDVDTAPSGAPFLVMHRLEGRDLESERRERTQPSVAEAFWYLRPARAAMAATVRQATVHRDLEPSKLFLAAEGSPSK
jgi:serine/threonine-protein kinase